MIAGQANRVENSDGASHLSVPSLDAELPVPAEVFLALSTAAITVSWKASTRQSQWLKNRLLKRVSLLSSVVDSSKLNHDARQSTAEIGNSLAVVWQCQLRQNCRQSVSMTSCSQMLRLEASTSAGSMGRHRFVLSPADIKSLETAEAEALDGKPLHRLQAGPE